ncbi:hypothetical protein DL240_01880 [Lujinxingia litoralis]|uniref:Uncharacterized protein n=1 Tax=Lujinxingia litoralis TaxID=2211119 RepID=A0A328CAX4_9DELT|nr:hypothetical protein [Lujinxingia litoralis]RAL24984.1 hypothetical protein DL240_01880 [Lujinxingia litoralis]
MMRTLLARTPLLLLVVALLSLSGCLLDPTEPGIASMTITPSVISLSETGMTDEYFTIELTVVNFTDEIEEVTVFTQSPEIEAVPQSVVAEGNVVVLSGISKSWFTNFDTGAHPIGATVTSASASITERNLATVTIEAAN